MKSDEILFEAEYKRHAIGWVILISILATPFIAILVSAWNETRDPTARLALVGGFLPAVVGFAFVIQRLLKPKKIRISQTGILYGDTFRPWEELKEIKPLRINSFGEKKYHLMCSYKGFGLIGIKIPLGKALTESQYDDLATKIEERVSPLYDHLKVKR